MGVTERDVLLDCCLAILRLTNRRDRNLLRAAFKAAETR